MKPVTPTFFFQSTQLPSDGGRSALRSFFPNDIIPLAIEMACTLALPLEVRSVTVFKDHVTSKRKM